MLIPVERHAPLRAALVAVLLAACWGCGPSRTQRANERVELLTKQAETFYQTGDLDEARQAIDEALAVEGATETARVTALAEKMAAEQRQSETEQFEQRADEALRRAAELADSDGPEAAVAWVARSVPIESALQRELGLALLQRVQQATNQAAGAKYWKGFELAELTDFREKGRLPDDWQSAVAAGSPHVEALRQMWSATLRRTLSTALAKAEARADKPVDPDHLLPAPTIEEVAADPAQWNGKEVQFDHAWIDGRLVTSMRQGRLLTVTSEAGNKYEPYIKEGVLVFSTYGSVAQQLKSIVSPGDRVEARLFCRISRGRQTGPTAAKSFYRAIVFKVELYMKSPDEENP